MAVKERPDLDGRARTQSVTGSPQTSALGQLGRGVADVPGVLGGTLDMLSRGAGFLATGGQDIIGDQPTFETKGRKLTESMLGPDVAAQTGPQRLARAVGRGAGTALATLPLSPGGLGMGAGRALLEIGSGAAGEAAATGAEMAGAGGAGQLAAGVAGSALPGTLLGIAGRVGGSAMQMAHRGVRNRAANRVVSEVLGRRIQNRDEAMRLLQAEIDTPLFGQATTAQVLEDIAPGIQGLEKQTARGALSGDDLRREVHALRVSGARAMREFGDAQFGGSAVGGALQDYAAKLGRIRDKVERAYRGLQNLEGVPTRKLKATVAQVRMDAGDELVRHLPEDELRLIEKYGSTTDLAALKRLRTAIGESLRELTGKQGVAQRERYLNMLADGVEETFTEVAEMGGSEAIHALNNARRIRRIQAERFDPRDPLNKILGGEFEDVGKRFKAFLNGAPRPAQTLETARLTLGDNPAAWGGIQKLMKDEVFGENFGLLLDKHGLITEGGAGKALQRLDKHSAAFDVIYGQGAADNARRFLRRARQLGSGVVGKASEFAVSGSNVGGSAETLAQAGVVADVIRGNWRAAAFKAIQGALGRAPNTMEEADRVLGAALAHPSTARGFLEHLPAEAVPIWHQQIRNAVTRPTRVGIGLQFTEEQ